jgi:hypothetical protein
MSRSGSKKFEATHWMERLVPVVLVILLIGLAASILIVLLS